MKKSRLIKRILSLSLACVLCLGVIALNDWGSASESDDEEAAFSESEGEDTQDAPNGDDSDDDGDDDGSDPDDGQEDDGISGEDDAEEGEDGEPGGDDPDGEAGEDEDEDEGGEADGEGGGAGSGNGSDGSESGGSDAATGAADGGDVNLFSGIGAAALTETLTFEIPQRRVPSGEPVDPLEGVVVLDENGDDVTEASNLYIQSTDPSLDQENPEPGVYSIILAATHPVSGTEYTDTMLLEVYKAGGDATITLSDQTGIELGGTSIINMTANLDTGSLEGRYILIEAPADFGMTFNISNVNKLEAVSDIELIDGQTVLLTLDDASTSIISMDFPVSQTMTYALSTRLDGSDTFTFTAKLYVDLTDVPDGSETPLVEDSQAFGLADHAVTTLTLASIIKSGWGAYGPGIDGHNTSFVFGGDEYIEDFELYLNKGARMRSSYRLDLLVPVNSALTPAASGNYTIETYNGQTCFVVELDETDSFVSNYLINPQASYTGLDTNVTFRFTPAFTGLDSLAAGSYEATEPVTLRIHQYGGVEYQELDYSYTLTKTDYADPQLRYEVAPTYAFMGSKDQEIRFRPIDFTSFEEPIYTDLQVTVTIPYQSDNTASASNYRWYTVTGIEMGANYGSATVQYSYLPLSSPSSSNTVTKSVDLAASEYFAFGIPDGYQLKEIVVKPDRMDTTQGTNSTHFTLIGDVSEEGGRFTAGVTRSFSYTLNSSYHSSRVSATSNSITLINDDFAWNNADIAISPEQTYDSSSASNWTYYLFNRPQGDAPVAYFHYNYKQLVGAQDFTLTLNSSGTSDEFLKGLTAIRSEPNRSGSTFYVSGYTATYTTSAGATATVSPDSNRTVSFNLADDEYVTALTIEFSTTDWTSYGIYHNLFGFYMDLNRDILDDLPSITSANQTLPVSVTLANSKGNKSHNGSAGVFVRDREPAYVSGNYVEVGVNRYELQSGANVTVSVSQLLTAQNPENIGDRPNGSTRLTLNGMTTYIPVSSDFTYVEGSANWGVSNIKDFQTGDLSIGDVQYVQSTDGGYGWLIVNWNTFTTGAYGTSDYADDPILTFDLRVSPLAASGAQAVPPSSIYNDLELAVSSQPQYDLSNVGADGSGSHDFYGTGAKTYGSMTKGDASAQVYLMVAASYGVELYGKINNDYYSGSGSITYYDHQDIEVVVKMNYETREAGGYEDGVIYIPIPGASGTHGGLKLTGPVNIDELPAGSSVGYSTASSPSMSMITDWDSMDSENYTSAADWEQVTMIRIVGMNLNQEARYAYIPLGNAVAKEQIYDQNIQVEGYIQYHTNRQANKNDTVNWLLTDYTISGYFWNDSTGTGILTDNYIGGHISARSVSTGKGFATQQVSSAIGYSMRIPSYGDYVLTAVSSGYQLTPRWGNGYTSQFDPSTGTQTVTMGASDGLSKTVHAGFVADTDTSRVTVVFVANGATNVPDPQYGTVGQPITKPEDPEMPGYTFDAWYEGNADGSKLPSVSAWNFSDGIPETYRGGTMYLVAEWKDQQAPSLDISDIDFGERMMPTEYMEIHRFSPVELHVGINDAPDGAWDLTVRSEGRLSMTENGQVFTIGSGANDYNLFFRGADNNEQWLSSGAKVYDSVAANGARDLDLMWGEAYGILLQVWPGDVQREGYYQTTLTWSIEYTP